MANPGQESGVVIGEGVDLDIDGDGLNDVAGFVAMGEDNDNKARAIELQGEGRIRTEDENTLLLEQILDTLKHIEYHLSVASGDELGPQDID